MPTSIAEQSPPMQAPAFAVQAQQSLELDRLAEALHQSAVRCDLAAPIARWHQLPPVDRERYRTAARLALASLAPVQIEEALETAARLVRIREPQRFTSMVDARPTVASIVETYINVLTGQRRRG